MLNRAEERSLRICFVNPFYDRTIGSGEELIARYRHLAEMAGALRRRGHEIFVVQAFHTDKTIETAQAIYRFARMPHRGTLRLVRSRTNVRVL